MASTGKEGIIELALAGDLEGVKNVVENTRGIDVDITDSSGMTALQQAAFRGNEAMCKYLLEKGANVNSDKHENQYTALMFAALSGNEEVVKLLLEAGAKVDAVNSVRRTAAEMAAFVSQYHIAGVINNYVSTKELLRFTKVSGQEKAPKLPKELLPSFHRLINDFNINPIHILKYLSSAQGIVESSKSLQRALDILVLEKMAPHDTHEGLALKLHFLACILDKANDGVDALMKRYSKGKESDGFLEYMELFVRSTLKSFPRTESNLFKMLIQKLTKVQIGEEPTALSALMDAINGTRMKPDRDEECMLCFARKPKKCTRCQEVFYCDQVCQKLHWPTHKRFCKKPENDETS